MQLEVDSKLYVVYGTSCYCFLAKRDYVTFG